jgi:hypothetical protein
LPGGDLVIPGIDSIFRIDPSGTLKAQAKLGPCTWLRTINDDRRIRFACARLDKEVATTIIEYDELLKIKSEIAVGDENVGVPAVCELANGTVALLANNTPKAPFVQIYTVRGKALNKYKLAAGAVKDCLPISSTEFVVLHYTARDTFISVLTWMKAQ